MTDYKEEAEDILYNLEQTDEFRWVNWMKGDTKKMVLKAMHEFSTQRNQSLTKELEQAKELIGNLLANHEQYGYLCNDTINDSTTFLQGIK